MSNQKHISEIIKKTLRQSFSFMSPVYSNPEEYEFISFQQAKVKEAYFAPSYVQKHEDFHLWFETSKGQKEFVLTDVAKTGKLFSILEKTKAEDFVNETYRISLSKNKSTNKYLVSSLLVEGSYQHKFL